MAAAEGQEREVKKSYWMEHTADLTVEAMMLDSKAADLDKEERPEILYDCHNKVGSSLLGVLAGALSSPTV